MGSRPGVPRAPGARTCPSGGPSKLPTTMLEYRSPVADPMTKVADEASERAGLAGTDLKNEPVGDANDDFDAGDAAAFASVSFSRPRLHCGLPSAGAFLIRFAPPSGARSSSPSPPSQEASHACSDSEFSMSKLLSGFSWPSESSTASLLGSSRSSSSSSPHPNLPAPVLAARGAPHHLGLSAQLQVCPASVLQTSLPRGASASHGPPGCTCV